MPAVTHELSHARGAVGRDRGALLEGCDSVDHLRKVHPEPRQLLREHLPQDHREREHVDLRPTSASVSKPGRAFAG
eukprot:571031-Rhodomonas_salina.1